MEDLEKLLRALLAVQIEQLYSREAPQKPEIVLSRAGLSHAEIATLLGKNTPAVAKAISRSK